MKTFLLRLVRPILSLRVTAVTLAMLALVAFLCIGLTGCNDFERTTFQSLSASKAVIDQAQADYEARTIPHVQASFDAITKAKQAQTAAVDAMIAYEQIKAAKGSATALQAQQQIVAAALAQIVPLVADIKMLISPVKTSSLPYAPRRGLRLATA